MGERLRAHGPLLAAAIASLVLLVGLWPELRIGHADLNDHCYHGPIIARLAEALQHGENPLDCWMGEWTLGHPVPRTYQPLPHLVVASAWLATLKSIDLETLFIVVRTLLLAAWPLTIYASARMLRLERATAACCALVAPLVATAGWYGLELGSHAWRGSGLFTQLWGMHALALTFAAGVRALRWGRSCTLAAALIALTFACHLVYGQIAALSLVAVALVPAEDASWRRRLVRLATMGALSAIFAAWQLGPLLADVPLINRSRWEAPWKWNSVGLSRVGDLLWSGQLLDQDRLPILTLLCVVGLVAVALRGDATRHAILLLAAAWLLLFAGRPTWGPLLPLLGLGDGVPLHRLIGGAHLFLIFTAGLGLAALVRLVAGPPGSRARAARLVAACAVAALVLAPAVRERARWLGLNRQWGERNLAANAAEAADVARMVELAKATPGRTYPGLAASWGGTLKIGDVPLYAHLSRARVPALAFLYHSMALTSDTMVLFDERDPAQYRVFGVTRVVAARDQDLPSFLVPAGGSGRFAAWDAPGEGFFEVGHAPGFAPCDHVTLHDASSAWLRSPWPSRRAWLALDLKGGGGTLPAGLPAVAPAALPDLAPAAPGRVISEGRVREDHDAVVEAAEPATLVFKMTWNPRWRVTIDGRPAATFPVAPGFVAAPLPAGRHEVSCRYQPGRSKLALLALVPLVALGAAFGERRGLLSRIEERADGLSLPALAPPRRDALVTAGVVLLATLPIVAQYLHGGLVRGHDHLSYLPRLVEMHENVRHGIVLARWAPDLGAGHGQPLFLFAPPVLYWIGEAFHLVGFGFAWSLNLSVVVLVVGSALAMHRLASFAWGAGGGRLAAAAYVLAPYFCVDLFVRSALAEMVGFPLYPLVLDGILRHDATGRRRHLVQAALAWAALAAAHPPSALLFAPVPPALVVVLALRRRSLRGAALQAASLATGLLLSAFAWLPGLLEKKHVKIERLLAHASLRYDIHFVEWKQLLLSPWGSGLSVAGPDDGMSFELGRVHVVLGLVVLAAAWLRKDLAPLRLPATAAAALAALACFMTTGASRPLWDASTTLQLVQFEWRFLAIATVGAAFLAGGLARVAPAIFRERAGAAVVLAVAALLAVNLPHAQAFGRDAVDMDAWLTGALARRGAGVTTAEEYEPQVVKRPQPFDLLVVASPGIEILGQDAGPEHARATVKASVAGETWFRIYAYPGWTALLDGREVAHRVADPSGFLIVDVEPGTHEVEVVLRRTGIQRAGLALSLLGVLALAGLAAARRRDRPAVAAPSPACDHPGPPTTRGVPP